MLNLMTETSGETMTCKGCWGRVVGGVLVFVFWCLGILVDKSKYSIVMASLLLTGLSFPLRGQAWGHPG